MTNDPRQPLDTEWEEEQDDQDWPPIDEFRGIKRAIIGTLTLIVVGAGGWKISQQTVFLPRASEEHLQQAQEYLDDGQVMSAVIELKNALQKDEENVEAHYLLGQLYVNNGEMASAEKELRRARFLGYDEAKVAPLLARVYLALGKNDEFRALGVDALPAQPGSVLISQGNGVPALSPGSVPGVTGQTPGSTSDEVILNRARLMASERDLIGARAQVEAVLARNPGSSAALIVLGDIEVQEGNLDGAEEAFTRAMEAAINPASAQFKRALIRIEKKDFNRAQLDVYQLLDQLPYNPGVHFMQGVIHYQNQKYQEAIASLLIAEKDEKRYPRALLYSGISHHALGNYDQAREYASRFDTLAPGDVQGRRLLATIEMTKGDYVAAEKVIRPVVNANPDDWASMNLLANALLAQGNSEEGIVLLSIVAELQPNSSIAQARLGAGKLLGGDTKAGIEFLESALEANPDFQQADMLLVSNYVNQGNYAKALEAAEDYRKRNPDSARPYSLLGRVYLVAGQKDKAREAFLEAMKIDPAEADANHGLAEMAVMEGDYNQARTHYETVLAERENFLPTLLKLAEMAALQRDRAAMVAYLEQAIQQHPKQVAPRIMMGRHYLGIGKPAQVQPLFSELDQELQEQPQVQYLIALAQMQEEKYLDAKNTLENLAVAYPRSAQVHQQLARVHAALNEARELEAELVKAVEISPNYVPPRLMLARLYLSQGDIAAAKPQVEALRVLAPTSPKILVMEAAYARLQGDEDSALAFAERAYEEDPDSATLLELVRTLHEQGDSERAQILLTHWLRSHPNDSRVRLALANSNALNEDNAMAVQQYQELLSRDKDNVTALNNLAWFLKDSDPRLALVYAERAAELAPDWAAAQDTLALVLLNNMDLKRARQAIDRALRQSPDDPSVRYHSALINSRSGDRDRAIEMLEPIISSGQTFPEQEEALALFLQLTGGK